MTNTSLAALCGDIKQMSRVTFVQAVVRRMKIVGDLDLSEKENRVTFEYCYLEWSKV